MSRRALTRVHPAIGWTTVLLVCGVWLAAFWANLRGLLPPWALFLLAPALLVAALLALARLSRTTQAEDALSPWRRFRAVKRMTLVGDATESCRLLLDLVPESDLNGPGVTLVFRGIARLRVLQFDAMALNFDYLVCQPVRVGPKRFRVRDRSGECIAFLCESFEQVPAMRSEASA